MTYQDKPDTALVVAKPLAWSILVALVAGGIWVGVKIGSLDDVSRRVAGNEGRLVALEHRQGATEREAAVIVTRLEAILSAVGRIERNVSPALSNSIPH